MKGRKRALEALRYFSGQMFLAEVEARAEGDADGQKLLTALGIHCQKQMSETARTLADEVPDAPE